ncbi:hypothetical protein LAZ67_4003261 [Cordylochernes scorpioides]|uniref:RNA-directed DNA polymerase n=1 Tax=Cordylochernes scorpioides TaxID=51811 RepID=A0ABY6KDH9_9ARAC|nr:hypothetical protein LAZ67_4003261 [Cordylochernes scorpioides]
MAQIQPPETFDFSTPNEWPKWRKRFERYLVVSGMKKKEEADKIDLFMYLMGDRADDIFRTFKFEKEEEATKIDSVLKAFDSHFCVRKNIIYGRVKFNSRIQEDREPVDEFITSLYKLADSCEFEGLHEQLICDRIVVGVRDKALSERMQLDSELTLEKTRPSTSQKVKQVKLNSKKQSPKQQKQPSRKKEKSAKTRSYVQNAEVSPTGKDRLAVLKNKDVTNLKKKGHFSNCCPDKQAKTAEVKAVSKLEEIVFFLEVSAVEDSSNLDDDEGKCRRRWTAEIQVNRKQMKFKLDSQADVTCVPLCLFKKIMGQQRLVESDFTIRGAEFSELQTEKIYVICPLSEPLLSRRAYELLNLVRRIEVVATRINSIKEFPEVFEGLGQIGNPYEIVHIPGKELLDADALSRQPLLTTEGGENERPTSAHINAVLSCITDKDEMLTKIFEAQQEDTTLKAVVNYLEQGWPDKKKMSQALLSYWHVKNELGVQNGLLMRSCCLVISASMKLEILDKLHAGHFGITKTRLRACETVWWPGISEEIAETVRKCSVCIQEAVSKHEPLIPTNFPTRPWQKIGMDLFKFENKWYLVVIDYYSRFPEMIQLDRITANVVVRSCKSIFAQHGIPETVVSDNGTQFGAACEFANFARQYGFTHVTSSPRFPQSNGMAEAGVKIAKLILKKNQDPSLGLLEYRSTPLENSYSPAELLMGCKLRTTLPIAPENLNPRLLDSQTLKRKEGRKDMKSRYDRRCGATDMEELSEGDTVWITDMRIWGIVKQKASTPRSYMVDTPVGTLRRNRFHLRKGDTVQYPADPSRPTFSGEELVGNEKTPVVDYPSNDSEDGQIRTRKRQEEAFQTLKTALLSPPILGHFNPNAPTYVHTDASNIGIGATLVQDIGGEEKVISYLSRTLSKAEQNYSTTEKECLAVVWSMSKLRPYLYGRHFKIVTDHHALCWLKNLKDPTGRLARWALKIQEYDFDIIHKSGKKHLDADGLSRGPLPETDWDEDFERLFLNQITDEEDKFIESVKKNLNGSRRSIAQNFKEEDGCLFKKNPNPEGRAWLLVVPENKKREIMKEYHNHMSNGHLGVARTMYRIKSKYFWPSMLKDVSEFVKTCHLCQSRKGSNQLPSGLLQPIPPANFPFERIGIDFVGPLPSTKNRKKWIIVLSDYYTRYAETRAVSEATVKEVSKFLVEDIFLRHGAPQYLISDRGSQFTSNLMKEVMKTCKIKHCFTTSYHPQTNGLTERLNRTLINMLSMYVNTDQKNWDEILPFITHAYNTTIQETTGYSPFFLMFGREPTSLLDDRNISVDIDKDDYDEYIKHHLDKINRTRKLVINNTIKTQERMKKNYDKKHNEKIYEPGHLVAVWTPVRKIGKCEKLLRKYFGPYRILKKLSNVNYLIEPKDNPGQDPLIVHVSRLKPYFERIDECADRIITPLPGCTMPTNVRNNKHLEWHTIILISLIFPIGFGTSGFT